VETLILLSLLIGPFLGLLALVAAVIFIIANKRSGKS